MPCPFTMLSHDLQTNPQKNMNKEILKNSSYDLVTRMIILKIDVCSQFALLKDTYLKWINVRSTAIIDEYPDINGNELDIIKDEFDQLLDLMRTKNSLVYEYYTKGGNNILKNIIDNNICENVKNDVVETSLESADMMRDTCLINPEMGIIETILPIPIGINEQFQ